VKEMFLTIDSKEVRCEEGEILLTAAQKAGIYIPVLCHHPALSLSTQIKPNEVIYRGEQRIDCDFTIAADNAIFGQAGPRTAVPACGYMVVSLAYVVGMKKAKEMWMLCRRYSAQQGYEMGLVNAVVPDSKLEEEVDKWCEE
jgi:hypothetical protein